MANDSTALVRHQQTAVEPFEPQNIEQAINMSEHLSHATLLPTHLRQKPADIFATLLLGRDLGLTPMQSIVGIHCIEGKPSVSAQTAIALVKRSPACVYFRLVESDDQVAIYETQRKGEPSPARMRFTIEEARRAGLATKKNWQAYPSAMLRARCSMALARDVYPDVLANLYDPDELDATEPAPVVMQPPPPRPPAPPKPAAVAAPFVPPQAPPPKPQPAPDSPPPEAQAKVEAIRAAAPAQDAPAAPWPTDDVIYQTYKARLEACETGTQADLDAVIKAVGADWKAGTVTDDEKRQLAGVYRVVKGKIEARAKAEAAPAEREVGEEG